MKNLNDIKKINNIKNIPEENGVYFFYDKNKNILYIGKSTNLKNRILSYFAKTLIYKTKKMISISRFYSYIKVESEIEALLLESELIKKYKPKFNIELKDDKRPLYIKITSETYPRVLTARKIDKKDYISFFGPFPSSQIVKDVLRLIRSIFPYSQHKVGKRPCLFNQINLCNPCPSNIENIHDNKTKILLRKQYQNNIKNIINLLKSKNKTLRYELSRSMNYFSKRQLFEQAINIRDQIRKIDYITQKHSSIEDFLENPNLLDDQRKKELIELSKILSENFNMKVNTQRIECFDVSHLYGTNTTASMVTFIKGESEKSLYRHFRIRQKKGNDDVSSLKEVILRRLNHFSDWGKPDLIIVDGGKPQVGVFFNILKSYKIPIIGLAKRYELIILPKLINGNLKFQEFNIEKLTALNLLVRLRNEAHRFAQKYHHKLVKKDLLNIN